MNIRSIALKLRLAFYRSLPIKKTRIVFLSHLGKTYACNPRYLCEYMAAKYPGKYELIWIFDKTIGNPPELPAGVRPVPYFSHLCLRVLANAGVIISNTRISDAFFFSKRPGQFYLQTWHSSMRLKCIEADAHLGKKYEDFAKKDSSQIDLIISGGKFSTEIFHNSFWYKGDIAETGTPRIDWLRNQTHQSKAAIFQKANLDPNVSYLLYAPTFRKDGSLTAYNIDFASVMNALKQRNGRNWKVLYRLHPNLKGRTDLVVTSPDIIDMTDYDDIQELLVISSLLITDYSSSMFDAALSDITCILYASDLEQYLEKERNLYFDIKTLPFPLAKTSEDLCCIIRNHNEEDYHNHVSEFLFGLGSCERGNACEKIEHLISSRL